MAAVDARASQARRRCCSFAERVVERPYLGELREEEHGVDAQGPRHLRLDSRPAPELVRAVPSGHDRPGTAAGHGHLGMHQGEARYGVRQRGTAEGNAQNTTQAQIRRAVAMAKQAGIKVRTSPLA
jgi:hypothetical protein